MFRRVVWIFALLIMAVLLTGSISLGGEVKAAEATIGVDDYPAKLKAANRDALVDPWNFYNRECTSFVAWRLNNDNKVSFNNWYKGKRWGNAGNWGSTARKVGIKVDSTPAIGAVAWWAYGKSGSYGHVAYVKSFSGNNVTVEEYNIGWSGKYRQHTYKKSAISGFIHIKDLSSAHSHNYSTKTYSFYNNVNHTVTSKCSCGASKSSRENCSFAWSGITYKCSKCGTEYAQHTNGEYYTKQATSIFKGDNPSSGTQITIPAGTVVKVTSTKCSSWGRWVGKVSYGGKTGYIHLADAMYNGSAGKHTFKNGKCLTCGVTKAGSKAGVYKTRSNATFYYQNVNNSKTKKLSAGTQVTINRVGTSTYGYYWGYTPDGYVVSMDNLQTSPVSTFGKPITINDDDYMVKFAGNTSYVWDIYSGSKENSAKLTIYPKNNTGAQKFRFKRQSNGSYTIMNIQSGKYLDAANYGKTNGTSVIQYTGGTNKTNQQWYIERNSDGTFSFRGVDSNLYLHIYAGKVTKSNPVHLWQGCTNINAKWYLEAL